MIDLISGMLLPPPLLVVAPPPCGNRVPCFRISTAPARTKLKAPGPGPLVCRPPPPQPPRPPPTKLENVLSVAFYISSELGGRGSNTIHCFGHCLSQPL